MTAFRNLSISGKLLISFAILIVITLSSSGFILSRLYSIRDDEAETIRSHEILAATQRLTLAVVNQQTGLRGYFLSEDEAFLAPFRAGRQAFEQEQAKLSSLLTDEPEPQKRVAELVLIQREWAANLQDRQLALFADPAGRQEARSMEARGDGKAYVDRIKKEVDWLNDHVQQDLRDNARALEASFLQSVWSSLGSGSILLLLAVVLGVVLARVIAGPVRTMTATMRRLADGDLEADVQSDGRQDEIGQMAAALLIFRDNLARNRALEAAQTAEREGREVRARRLEALIAGFEQDSTRFLQQVGQAGSHMGSAAGELGTLAGRAIHESVTVANAAQQASANVQTVATAAEELSSSVNEISRQVAVSSQVTRRAVDEAEQTNRTVLTLSETADRITEIVNLISAIAGQTNLLALNATIEAARAGEAGKGFAVVASEVKNLAAQTSKATEEITAQVGAVQAASQGAIGAIRAIAGTIAEINEISSAIAAAVEEQGAATQEIARNTAEAAVGTEQVTNSIQTVRSGAEQTGAAARDVEQSADGLNRQAQGLTRRIEQFLSEVRAA